MTSQNYDIIKNNANATWHYVKRNMMYKKLQTVSDLIQRNEIVKISKQFVFRYSNLLFMKQQLSFYNFVMFQQYTSNGNNFWDFGYERYENCWCQLFYKFLKKCKWWYMYLLFFVAGASKRMTGGAILHSLSKKSPKMSS